MLGNLPTKASAFVVLKRTDTGQILCVVERDGKIGIPGGKWDPEKDGASWEELIRREFLEEIGVEIPESSERDGYLEWGGDRYQIRVLVRTITPAAAALIPIGQCDPDGEILGIKWLNPKNIKNGRPHIAMALNLLQTEAILAAELSQVPMNQESVKQRQARDITLAALYRHSGSGMHVPDSYTDRYLALRASALSVTSMAPSKGRLSSATAPPRHPGLTAPASLEQWIEKRRSSMDSPETKRPTGIPSPLETEPGSPQPSPPAVPSPLAMAVGSIPREQSPLAQNGLNLSQTDH